MDAMLLRNHAKIETNPLNLEQIRVPHPAEGEVRIKVRTCGVCHTDLHLVEGEINPPLLPVIPGHQVVGVVDEIGGSSSDFVKIGDRVGVAWLYCACRRCSFCKHGQENLCENAQFTGFHQNGGFAEYMIARADYLYHLPESYSDEEAAPLLCAGIIGYRSLLKADLLPGECLGLYGFGASAHLAIQVAKCWGCEVYVFTRSPQHQQHAKSLGADWIGGIDDVPPKKHDRSVIFAPSGRIVPYALENTRRGGTVAINAIHMSDIPEIPFYTMYGEKTLRSVTNTTYQNGVEFFKILENIPLQITTTIYPLSEANQALRDLKESKINGEAVLRIGD